MEKVPFNNWVIAKIEAFLKFKEGFALVHTWSTDQEGSKMTVQDAFGYQYEVHVRMIGRIITTNEDKDTGYIR